MLIAYFKEIKADYDEDRVYASDIKKVLNWYNMLQAKGTVSKEEPKLKKLNHQRTSGRRSEPEAVELSEAKPKKSQRKKLKLKKLERLKNLKLKLKNS